MSSSNQLEIIKHGKIEPLISDLIVPPSEGNLRKFLSLMTEKRIQEVLLPEHHQCSMISMTEILRCGNIEKIKPTTIMVHVPVLTLDATISQAARIMADYKIKVIPISDARKIIGQVNSSSMLRLLQGNLGNLKVSSLATQNPITIAANGFVATARELMVRKRIDHLPVKERDKLIGILTSAQIISVMSPRGRLSTNSTKTDSHSNLDFPVRNIMDTELLTFTPQASAQEVLNQMLKSEKTSALITQWEELQAIATQRDYISLLTEPEIDPGVPLYMVGLPDDPFEAEAAKQKFKRTINQLHKISPEIIEARSVIKAKSTIPGKERRRYEVTVHIKTPKNTYSYAASGWELAQVYDTITDRLKRLLSQKEHQRKQRTTEITQET
ncbi:MAG: CBS domain-containing protein [Candidatus Bathyarchaeia archaeon]